MSRLLASFLDNLGSSRAVHVRPVRELLRSALGVAAMNKTAGCSCNCSDSNVEGLSSVCGNGSFLCPCMPFNPLSPTFASLSYLIFVIATVQLVLCMVHDAMNEEKPEVGRWKKSFRLTTQKCLLGAVIAATGTRAIYYTVQDYIPEQWADILQALYYPALLSAFSLLICFWAEFYNSPPADGHDFIKKHQYSVAFTLFNVVVYLLLVADVIATPLVKDKQEQAWKSGIICSIFALFFFATLVGFLHLAIRLFFRPDWQPLFVQLEHLKINIKQQAASCFGIVSNALMQSLIICLLVFNMVSRFLPVDSNSLYVCAIVIQVTELCMPLWFCCSLWNFRQPKRLWILNPSLLLHKLERRERSVSETEPLTSSGSSVSSYGSISPATESEDLGGSCESTKSKDGECWVCKDSEDSLDYFYPCKCRLHRKCIKQWIATRASNTNISEREYLKCQVCGERYRTKKIRCVCPPQGFERKHWLQAGGVTLVFLVSVVAAVCVGVISELSTKYKIVTICSIGVLNIVLLKLMAFGLRWMCRMRKATAKDIVGSSTPPVLNSGRKHRRAVSLDLNSRTAISRMIEDSMECSVTVPYSEKQSTVQAHPDSEV